MNLIVFEPKPSIYDVLTIVIASFSLILSIMQWIYVLRNQRFNISVFCTGYSIGTSELIEDYQNNTFGFVVNNRSSLPISINCIKICTTSKRYKDFDLTRRFMKEHFIPPGLDNSYRFFTSDFPVNIEAYSSALIYATYETKDSLEHVFIDDESRCYFEFVTNRKIKKTTLLCHKIDLLSQ